VNQFYFPLARQSVLVTLARARNPNNFFQVFPAPGSGGSPYHCVRNLTSTNSILHGTTSSSAALLCSMVCSHCAKR
jgi:hypothetical protein